MFIGTLVPTLGCTVDGPGFSAEGLVGTNGLGSCFFLGGSMLVYSWPNTLKQS